MKEVKDTGFPPGTVAIISNDMIRCVPFVWSLLNLKVPTGTTWAWQVSAYVHENRNESVKKMLGLPESQWILFLDDDNTFEPDHLLKLLKHDKDIVGSFYVKKGYPCIPHIYRFPAGKSEPPYENIRLMDVPAAELLEVDAVATGGLLIRRRVLENPGLKEHPFEFLNHMGEDISFCYKAQKLGYKIYADTEAVMEHWGLNPVRPGFTEDGTQRVILMRHGKEVDLEIP